MTRTTPVLAALALAAGLVVFAPTPAQAVQTSRHCGSDAAWQKSSDTHRGIKVTLWTAPLNGGLEVCAAAQDVKHRSGSVRMAVYVYGDEDDETYRATSGSDSASRHAGTDLTVREVYVRASTGKSVHRFVWHPKVTAPSD